MGFPVGYTEVILPRLLLHTLTFLGLFRAFLLSLLRSLGLSSLLLLDPRARPNPLLVRVVPFSGALESPSDRCVVCLCEFRGGEDVHLPLNCRHVFHRTCLDRWVIDHGQWTCPLCRAHVIAPDLVQRIHQRLVAANHYSYIHDEDGHFVDDSHL